MFTVDRVAAAPDAGPLTFVNNFYTTNQTIIQTAALGITSLDNKAIEGAISNFGETAKVMVQGLNALCQVHPVIGGRSNSLCITPKACIEIAVTVAVLAFKLVISLDMTRRNNNKKVVALKLQMQDMMAVLFQ